MIRRSSPLRRKTPLKRCSLRRTKQTTKKNGTACGACKLGTMTRRRDATVHVWISDDPGGTYDVQVPTLLECDHCGRQKLSKAEKKRAWAAAYRLHTRRVFERDKWTCRRCGDRGVPFECAHLRGFSRARNPGRTKHAMVNLETCCVVCHRAEHR